MRQVPARYVAPEPARSKKGVVARTKHWSAPLKGLSLSSKLTVGDPLTATILENFLIEEDRISCRPGSKLAYTHSAHKPIWCLVPHYSTVNIIAAATNGELRLLNDTLIKGGFLSDDWHWTSFSNLSAVEYTVMVNGRDGVWSWDGSPTSTAPAVVTVTNLSKSVVGGPAVCTVAAGDIGKFSNGQIVFIAGGLGTGMTNANGYQMIYNVGAPANTFSLAGVDTSTAGAAQTTGVTATTSGTGMVKENVTAPAWLSHIVPNQFQIVVSHMNRLFFADNDNLSVYYLPLQQKGGMVSELPLNAVFKRGGTIRAMYTWTLDGGEGLNDQLVIFSSNGECVIYEGLDPDSDFSLAGIYRFDSPMSKHSILNYGGELYVLVSTGLVPMSTLMRAETEQLGKADKNIYSAFLASAQNYRDFPGWGAFLNPNTGRAICNMPLGGTNQYTQYVRAMQNPAWSRCSGLPARCWGWMRGMVYFGSDDGRVYEFDPRYLSDQDNLGHPVPIKVDVQMAWSNYNLAGIKHFKMVLPHLITDGVPKPFVDIRVDYDSSDPENQPDVTQANLGSTWDIATWDVDYWAGKTQILNNWQGVGRIGRVGAVRITASILNCEFAIAGFDVIYEEGSVFG